MVNQETSGLVGGDYECETHGFKTADPKAWNEHCKKFPNIHYEQGSSKCIDCGKNIKFDGVPFHNVTPQGKNVSLRCKECLTKYIDSNKALLGLK